MRLGTRQRRSREKKSDREKGKPIPKIMERGRAGPTALRPSVDLKGLRAKAKHPESRCLSL